MTNIRSLMVKGSLWISVGRIFTNASQALSTIVLARILAPADFGVVALATSMLAVLSAFTELSMSQALIRTSEPTAEHYNTAWTLGLARGLLLGAGFAVAGPFLASAYNEPRLDGIMYALAISAVIGGLSNPKLAMLTKGLQFHQTAILGIASSLASVLLSVGVAAFYKSYWALVVGILAGQVVNVVLSYVFLPYRPGVTWSRFRELWGFSVWVSLSQIVNTLNYRLDQLLVGLVLGRQELGYYTVGSRLATLPGQELVRPLTATLFPAFRMVADDKVRLRSAYARVQGLVTAIALPASLGFGLIADPAVRLLLGEKWIGAIPVVQLSAILFSTSTLGTLVVPLALACGETKTIFVRNLQMLVVRAPIMMIGLYQGGLMGMLYARMVAGVIGVAVDLVMIRGLIDLSVVGQLRANIRCFIASAVMAAVALGIQAVLPPATGALWSTVFLVFIIAASAASYVGASFILWLLTGRPAGPEKEVLDAGRSLLRRIGRRSRLSPTIAE